MAYVPVTISLDQVKELLRAYLAGEADFEEHAYITCTDEFDVNASRGCDRCIIQEFLRSP